VRVPPDKDRCGRGDSRARPPAVVAGTPITDWEGCANRGSDEQFKGGTND